jgi:hypothetical protein
MTDQAEIQGTLLQFAQVDQFNARAFALEQAVKLYADRGASPTNPSTRNGEIVAAATVFEAYLASAVEQGQRISDAAVSSA